MTGQELIIFYKKMIDFIESNNLKDYDFNDYSKSYLDCDVELNNIETVQYGIPKTPHTSLSIDYLKSNDDGSDVIINESIDSVKARELRGLA